MGSAACGTSAGDGVCNGGGHPDALGGLGTCALIANAGGLVRVILSGERLANRLVSDTGLC